MANCIRCGRKLPLLTFGKLRNVCKWCVEYEAMQKNGVDDDARQRVMPAPWANRSGGEGSMIMTKVFAGICAAAFIGMALASEGKSIMDPPGQLLGAWGANFGPLTLSGDWWRLLTATFLHGGIIHIALNMWCLWSLGELAEPLYGHWTFAAVYILCGLAGSLVSLAHNPFVLSVGASGAVFGVAGALIASLKLGNFSLPQAHVKAVLSSVVSFAIYNLIFGAVSPGIDNAAHIGGLIAGLIIGAMIALAASEREHVVRRITLLTLFAALLFGAGVLAQHAFGAPASAMRMDVLIELKKYDQALAEIQKGLARDPNSAALHLKLANVYESQGRQDEQEAELRRAISINPSSEDSQSKRFKLGALLGKRQRYAESREVFSDMLKADPKSADAHLGFGLVFAAQNDHASAVKEFETAAQLGANEFILYYNMGMSYQNLGKTDQALDAYVKAAAFRPRDPDVMAALADVYDKRGMKDEAERFRRQAEILRNQQQD